MEVIASKTGENASFWAPPAVSYVRLGKIMTQEGGGVNEMYNVLV